MHADSVLLWALWIGSVEKCDVCRRLQCAVFLNLKTSFNTSGDMPLATLYISIASACILSWFIETELSLFKKVLQNSKFDHYISFSYIFHEGY